MPRSPFRATLREHLLLSAVVAVYWAVAWLMARWAGLPPGTIRGQLYLEGLSVLLPASALVAAVVYLLHLLLVLRPASPLRQLRRDLDERLRWRERLWAGLPMIPLLSVFMSVFSSWKIMIPELQPFRWDPAFQAWDEWLHGGVAPWRWLQPWLGRPALSSAINFSYNFWVFAVYFTLIWQIFSLRDRRLRLQFLLGFLSSWVLLGSLAATLLSAAGPCYFGRVTGLADPYLPLMSYLQDVARSYPMWSLEVQAGLWKGYQAGHLQAAAGISAMPSMHVSSTLLITLLMWRTSPVLGGLAAAFLATILLGSVHLGWHYAIDGYVSIVATLFIWSACGWIVRRYMAGLPTAPASEDPAVSRHSSASFHRSVSDADER